MGTEYNPGSTSLGLGVASDRLDTAKRNCKQLAASFCLDGTTLKYEHDGGPFTDEDLAALILAGSAKPFENSLYTGRFGSGFLVTHAVSTDVDLSGSALTTEDSCYPSGVGGSEAHIEQNIADCYSQLETPQDCSDWTKFEYKNLTSGGSGLAERGLILLDELLPYVFAFNDVLKQVEITNQEHSVCWTAR